MCRSYTSDFIQIKQTTLGLPSVFVAFGPSQGCFFPSVSRLCAELSQRLLDVASCSPCRHRDPISLPISILARRRMSVFPQKVNQSLHASCALLTHCCHACHHKAHLCLNPVPMLHFNLHLYVASQYAPAGTVVTHQSHSPALLSLVFPCWEWWAQMPSLKIKTYNLGNNLFAMTVVYLLFCVFFSSWQQEERKGLIMDAWEYLPWKGTENAEVETGVLKQGIRLKCQWFPTDVTQLFS